VLSRRSKQNSVGQIGRDERDTQIRLQVMAALSSKIEPEEATNSERSIPCEGELAHIFSRPARAIYSALGRVFFGTSLLLAAGVGACATTR